MMDEFAQNRPHNTATSRDSTRCDSAERPKYGAEDARSRKCRQVTEVEQGLKESDWTYAMEVAEVGRHVARLFPKQRAAEDLQQQPPNAGIKPSHEVASA
jgi:hypothetical protein